MSSILNISPDPFDAQRTDFGCKLRIQRGKADIYDKREENLGARKIFIGINSRLSTPSNLTIFEIKLEGGILPIFRSKSQVVPYGNFSKK